MMQAIDAIAFIQKADAPVSSFSNDLFAGPVFAHLSGMGTNGNCVRNHLLRMQRSTLQLHERISINRAKLYETRLCTLSLRMLIEDERCLEILVIGQS
jgi:hypothetical protein